MALSEQDREAIRRVAYLLTGDQQGAKAKAKILEAQNQNTSLQLCRRLARK